MIIINKPNFALMRPQQKVIAWALLILLTLTLLLFPTKIITEYRPVQAPYIFNNLPIFAILFCFWVLCIFWIGLSSDKKDNPRWEHLVLVGIAGLCIISFWVLISPYGTYADSIYNMGHVRYLNEFGRIPFGNPVLEYFDFPGMHLLVSGISQLTRLIVFNSQTLFLIVITAFFPALLYILFTYWLKNSYKAFLAILLLLITSNVLIKEMRIFTPGIFGITLLVVFLIIQCKTVFFAWRQTIYLLLNLVFVTMTISYFATTFLLCLVLLITYFVQIAGKQKMASITLPLISLFIVIFMAWEIYWTRFTFNNLVNFFPQIISNIYEGNFLDSLSILSSTNIGTALPAWANVVRLFAWSLLLIATLLGIIRLYSLNKLDSTGKLQTSGLLGVLVLTIVGLFGTESGNQFYRYFLFAPFFALPILINFLCNKGICGRGILATIIVITVLLALPAFLLNVNTVSTDAIHSDECASGAFLELHSNQQGANLIIYRVNVVSASFVNYYIPNIQFTDIPNSVYYTGNQNAFWKELDKLFISLQNPEVLSSKQKILVINTKSKIVAQQYLGILPTAPQWEKMSASANASSLIYTNNHTQILVP